MKSSAFLFVVILPIAFLFAMLPTLAEPVRLPASGDPAFAFDAPEGWTISLDQYANLQFVALDRSTAVQLSMIADKNTVNLTTPDIAAGIFKSAGCQPYTRTDSGTLAGYPADNFYSLMVTDGAILHWKVTIARLDAGHIAVEAIMTKDLETPQETTALETLIADVRLTSAK